MRTLLISIAWCLLWSIPTQVYAQTCGTPSNFPNAIQGITTNSNPGPYTLRVFAHIIRRADGSGGMTAAELNTALTILSQDLQPHNICISLSGTDQILNNNFYNNNLFANASSIAATNAKADAIDLYFCPNTSPNPGGTAMAIPNGALVMGGTWPGGIVVNTSHILSHEFGHCMGLFHTHETYFGVACVNGSNCATAGDLVCDTPADPGLNFNVNSSTCIWNGSGIDPCGSGFPYNPDELNIMSYTFPSCMSYFSPNQGQRMRDHIATQAILQAATIPNNVFVQNIAFSSGQTLYAGPYSVTAGAAVTSGPQGPVTISSSSVVEFRARDYILFEPGFDAWPTGAGNFFTTLNPNLCGSFDFPNSGFTDPVAGDRSEQAYRPLLLQSEWLATTLGFEGYINGYYNSVGDTVVNGLAWTRVAETFIQLEGVNNDPSAAGPGTIHLLRESLEEQRVYRLDPVQGEQLLYDFALPPGTPLPGDDTFMLAGIDSVLLQDGNHERFTFQNVEGQKIVWVEGVGNIAHPFQPKAVTGSIHTLLCSRQEEQVVYDRGDILGVECPKIVSSVAVADASTGAQSVGIYPNPTSDNFTIEFGKSFTSNILVKVMDLMGRTLLQTTLPAGESRQILSLGQCPSGVYVLSASSNGKPIWIGKVLKE